MILRRNSQDSIILRDCEAGNQQHSRKADRDFSDTYGIVAGLCGIVRPFSNSHPGKMHSAFSREAAEKNPHIPAHTRSMELAV